MSERRTVTAIGALAILSLAGPDSIYWALFRVGKPNGAGRKTQHTPK